MKRWILSIACMLALAVHAQENISLRIGDPAPALKYSQWIKGTPVNTFKGNQLYILEFWATWCGPCIIAMPHVTKLQKQYEGKITVIGVNVWEGSYGHGGGTPESTLPRVQKFAEKNSGKMGFSVIADNNEEHMSNKWLKAAGITGIPSTFIIQNEKIVWIGHPFELDSTLSRILNGRYNMKEYKSGYEKGSRKSREDELSMAMKTVTEAIKAGEYTRANELIDKLMIEKPADKIIQTIVKFSILLKINQQEAIRYAEVNQQELLLDPNMILSLVVKENGLEKSIYLWAAKNHANSKPEKELSPMLLDEQASCYAKGGDYKRAIITEKKAIKGAKTALKEGKFIDYIKEDTVTGYKETLKKYRKAWNNRYHSVK